MVHSTLIMKENSIILILLHPSHTSVSNSEERIMMMAFFFFGYTRKGDFQCDDCCLVLAMFHYLL
jgi:hypothetical protein